MLLGQTIGLINRRIRWSHQCPKNSGGVSTLGLSS